MVGAYLEQKLSQEEGANEIRRKMFSVQDGLQVNGQKTSESGESVT